jgi:tripartite-type tricarboxylate transporter receptor subunit TctC
LNYFGAENFKAITQTDITVVTYKGTGPLTNDLMGGHVKLAFNTLPPAIGNIKAGGIRAIAVAAPERLAAIPDVPTTKEAGLALDIVQYYGLVAPAKTPKEIVARLNKELNKVLAMPDIKERLIGDGGAAMPSTPEAYAANIRDNESKWAALIKKLGLVVK